MNLMANVSHSVPLGQVDNSLNIVSSPFEKIKHLDEKGNEYWLARELMPLLGYERWENFESVIERARLSLINQGQQIERHLRGVTNEFRDVHNRVREQRDVKCSRLACYIITQNGDPRKKQIADGQGYFAISTHQYQQLPQDPLDMIAFLATETSNRLKAVEQSQLEQKQELAEVKEELKIVNPRSNYYTIRAYANVLNIPMPRNEANKLGRRAAAMSRKRGIDIGRVPDERDGQVNSYHVSVLEEVFFGGSSLMPEIKDPLEKQVYVLLKANDCLSQNFIHALYGKRMNVLSVLESLNKQGCIRKSNNPHALADNPIWEVAA